MTAHYDAAVVGAGILGLAHAYHLARRGLRVVVFERHARAQGASIRNFGMLWPIGQPAGTRYRLARRSLEIWLELLHASGLWHARAGSLHLAYHDDEAEVLREFVHTTTGERGCELLTAAQVQARFAAVRGPGLRAGMWSPTEVTVDPRQVIGALPAWLHRQFGVEFVFDTPVLGYARPHLISAAGAWRADRLLICTGADLRALFADAFAASGLVPCKLQMLRAAADERLRLGAMLAGGLTLRHYGAFAGCPTLPALVRRLDAEMPEYRRYGIHVMAAQNGRGELVIGDSHEYGGQIEPFDKAAIDEMILAYLQTFLVAPALRIEARWHGIYVKHPTEAYVVAQPSPGVTAITGVGGAGMTLSFGLAEQVVASLLGGTHDD